MPQVSIGQVENLSRAITAIEICVQELETETALRLAEVEQTLNETEIFLNESMQLVQQRESELATAEALLAAAQIALAAAEAALASAEASLAAAEASLASAEAALASVDFDSPSSAAAFSMAQADVAMAQADVAAARSDVAIAQIALAAAGAALVAAERNRDEAVRKYDLARRREEIAHVNYQKAQNLYERVMIECSARVNMINSISAEGKSRLEHALEALEAYLNSNSNARAVYQYLKWQPAANKPVMPQTIHDRLKLSPAQQCILIKYLYETDPVFRSKIEGYRKALLAANGQAERDAVFIQMSKNLSGEYAEKMVAFALSPLGDVQMHVVYELRDGKKTFTDIIISNLKEPVILGKGEGMMAPKGGSIAIEVKTGKMKYLKSQKEHMEYQAQAHANADASMILCSRDIKDLSSDEKAELRAALKEANSPILAMLPEKDDIDEALWKIILEENENVES